MDFLYFLVTGSESWEPRYHENFFITQGGFFWGITGALVIGVICACVFYFGFCNNKTSSKLANVRVWVISLLLCGVITYFYADLVIIGDSATTDNSSIFRSHSFYKANDDYFIQETSKSGVSETMINDLTEIRNKIKSNLDKGGDVRFDYDITTASLAIIFFFITSLFVKRFTITGKTIPFQNP